LKHTWLLCAVFVASCTAADQTPPAARPAITASHAPLSPAAATLLNYLNGLADNPRHVLSGQHSSYWGSNPLDYVQRAASKTGKTVAILGTTSGQSGSTQDVVALSNQWLDQNGIVLVSWWPIDPFTNAYSSVKPTSSSNFARLAQPGTAAYAAWYKILDGQIALLKQIKGPVLYRPFVELNGDWSWWQNQDAGTFAIVWQQMHDYFVSKGVTNVLWVYNVNTGKGAYTQYYPGANYVDVLSLDAYPPSKKDASTYQALLTLNQPIIYGEIGVTDPNNSKVVPNSADNSQLLAVVKAEFPKVIGMVFFCQNYGISEQQGASELLNDPAVVNRSDLPPGL
jgi:mannan endo-1,4-beta-mannosidase